MATARVVEQENWDTPLLSDWVSTIKKNAGSATKPVFFIAHSLGTIALAHSAGELQGVKIAGALLVAVPDLNAIGDDYPQTKSFLPVPTAPLSFPSLMVASRNDTYCSYMAAEGYSLDWGSSLIDAGMNGHINEESGHGPWPEGLMALSKFLNRLK